MYYSKIAIRKLIALLNPFMNLVELRMVENAGIAEQYEQILTDLY